MTPLTSLIAIAIFFSASWAYASWRLAAVGGFLITTAGINVQIVGVPATVVHYGISRGAPELRASDVFLVLAVLAAYSSRSRMGIGTLVAVFMGVATVLMLLVWGNTPAQQSGLILLVGALLAFGVGRLIALDTDNRAENYLATVVSGICMLQTLATVAQSRGILLLAAGDPEARAFVLVEDRMVGLYNHPSTLGKTVLLLLAFLLPLTASKSAYARNLAQIGIVFGLLGTLLTLARANSAAVAIALVIWVIINRREVGTSRRIATFLILIGSLYFNLESIRGLFVRNAVDPSGGERPELMRTGLRQLAEAPWEGIGANYYSEHVGSYDLYASIGFPVHNVFVLAAVELGIPLTTLFFVPLAVTYTSGFRRWRGLGHLDVRTAALASLTPGLILISFTGWGLLASASLPLWFLALGYLAGPPPHKPGPAKDHEARLPNSARR